LLLVLSLSSVFVGSVRIGSKAQITNDDSIQAPRDAITKSVTLYWSGGIPQCSNCGSPGQYACSGGIGKWNNGTQVFRDPSPDRGQTHVLTSVTALVYASVSCTAANSRTMLMLTLNDQVIDVKTNTSSNMCQCNTCDGAIPFASNIFSGGVPNYIYNGLNNVQLRVVDNNFVCVNRIELTLSFSIPDAPTESVTVPFRESRPNPSCAICNTGGHYACSGNSGWNGGQVIFEDPLPEGSVLLNAAVRVFGFLFTSHANPNVSISASLTGVPVGTIYSNAVVSPSSPCDSCSPALTLATSTWYQNGWPGYVVGGNNTLTVAPGGDGHTVICISFVQVSLKYYSPD